MKKWGGAGESSESCQSAICNGNKSREKIASLKFTLTASLEMSH